MGELDAWEDRIEVKLLLRRARVCVLVGRPVSRVWVFQFFVARQYRVFALLPLPENEYVKNGVRP